MKKILILLLIIISAFVVSVVPRSVHAAYVGSEGVKDPIPPPPPDSSGN
ncbi:hypothetical protein IBX73_10090 [candidate division WOR-3 bacterium]|nr:hypothetical protein [candidate division WOR-3 bacterium]